MKKFYVQIKYMTYAAIPVEAEDRDSALLHVNLRLTFGQHPERTVADIKEENPKVFEGEIPENWEDQIEAILDCGEEP